MLTIVPDAPPRGWVLAQQLTKVTGS